VQSNTVLSIAQYLLHTAWDVYVYIQTQINTLLVGQTNIDVGNQPFVDYFPWKTIAFPHLRFTLGFMFKSLFKRVFKPGLRKFSNRSLPDVEIPPKPPLTSHMIQQALQGPWGRLALSQWFLNSNNPWWLIIAVVSLQAWQRKIYYLMILPYIYINLQLYRIFNCQVWLLKSQE
jgi:hypothetical protein